MHLDIAKSFKIIYDTLRDNEELETKYKLKNISFQNFIWYLLLSPFCSDKLEFLNIAENFYKNELETNPLLNELVTGFLTQEIMPLNSAKLWEIVKDFEPFSPSSKMENTKLHFDRLQKEIIHHDLKVAELYYSRISLKRLAVLCNVSEEMIEIEIADMVCGKMLRAKIDRIMGVIDFRRQMQPADIMNDWSGDIKTLLSLVEETCHLINREHVIHTKS